MTRSRKLKKERQPNDQMKKDKWKSNDIQNIYIKPYLEQHEPQVKTGDELGSSGNADRPCTTCAARRVTLVTIPLVSHQ